MFKNRFISIFFFVVLCLGTTQIAYSAFKTGRIGGARNLVVTPVADLIAQINQILGLTQSQIDTILTDSNLWLDNDDIEKLNLDLDPFGGFPLDEHELAFLTHSLSTALLDNTSTLGDTQSSLQNLINSDVNSLCRTVNNEVLCNETAADWVHWNVDNGSADASLITLSLVDDLISSDSNYVDGYTSILLAASGRSFSDITSTGSQFDVQTQPGNAVDPNTNAPPNVANMIRAINYDAGFSDNASDANQDFVNNFLNNSDRGSFTLTNFQSCYDNNEASRSGGQGTCTVTASAWDQQLTALANFNSAKSTLAGGTALSLADLQAIPLNFGNNFTAPLQEWVASYISNQLSSSTGSSVSLTDWQNTVNGIDEGVAARWKIEQVANSVTGHTANDITNHLLARATDGTFDAATALGAGVSKTAVGFGGSTNINGLTSTSTPAQIQSAVLAYIGFTDPIYTAWLGNSDRANFALADFTACFNNNEAARSGGENICNIDASVWASRSSQLTYFAEAKDDLDDNLTLTQAQLTNIGLTTSSLGNPIETWMLEYLSSIVLDSGASLPSEWQTAINTNVDSQTAAQWKIAQLVTGRGAASELTSQVIETAGGEDLVTRFGAEIGTLQSNIRSGITTSVGTGAGQAIQVVSASNLETYVFNNAGFDDSTTISDLDTAIGNGWTGENYRNASNIEVTSRINGVTWSPITYGNGSRFYADNIRTADILRLNNSPDMIVVMQGTGNPSLDSSYLPTFLSAAPIGSIVRLGQSNNNIFKIVSNHSSEGVTLGFQEVNVDVLNSHTSGLGNYLASSGAAFVRGVDYEDVFADYNPKPDIAVEILNTTAGIDNNGWTNSRDDGSSFANCVSDSNEWSGGSGTCSLSKDGWTALSSIIGGSSLSSIDIDGLADLVDASGATSTAFANLPQLDVAEADYIRECLGTSPSVSQWSTLRNCVNNATLQKIATIRITGKILNRAGYANLGVINANDLAEAGIGALDTATGNQNVLTYVRGNWCDQDGLGSCEAAFHEDFKPSSSYNPTFGMDETNRTQILTYVRQTLLKYTQTIIDGQSIRLGTHNNCSTAQWDLYEKTGRSTEWCGRNPAVTCTGQQGWQVVSNRYLRKTLTNQTGNINAYMRMQRRAWWGGAVHNSDKVTNTNLTDTTHDGLSLIDMRSSQERTRCQRMDECFDAGGKVYSYTDNVWFDGFRNRYYEGARSSNYYAVSGTNVTVPYERNGHFDRTTWNSLDTGTASTGVAFGRDRTWNNFTDPPSEGSERCVMQTTSSQCTGTYDIQRLPTQGCSGTWWNGNNQSDMLSGGDYMVCVKRTC